jgi:hypothetical protein
MSTSKAYKRTKKTEHNLSSLTSTTPLAFELVCKDSVIATVGDAVGVFGELTSEQHEQYCWKAAIHMLNSAIKEPRYISAATITLQTALNLSGMLAQPSETDH